VFHFFPKSGFAWQEPIDFFLTIKFQKRFMLPYSPEVPLGGFLKGFKNLLPVGWDPLSFMALKDQVL
jgi:hypothetical protein